MTARTVGPGPLPDPHPGLTDGLITLRRARPDDACAIARACVDAEILAWTQVPRIYDDEVARTFIASHQGGFDSRDYVNVLAVDAATDELVASIGYVHFEWNDLVGEIGYWTAPWRRREGLTARALQLTARWGFEAFGLEKVECWIDVRNTASQATAAAAGFTREGILRSAIKARDESGRPDMVIYGMLPDEVGPIAEGEALCTP